MIRTSSVHLVLGLLLAGFSSVLATANHRDRADRAAGAVAVELTELSQGTGPLWISDTSWFPKSDGDFRRIGEYLFPSQGERFSRRTFLRTDPAVRAGFYLVATLSRPVRDLPEQAKVTLEWLRPTSGARVEVREWTLPPVAERSGRELWIGLTGAADVVGDEPLVAWRLTIRTAGGDFLADAASFLWEAPAK